jgi:NAD(P)-dependent dehydrogenase (short-subunit alcohol dehydrogenase family)
METQTGQSILITGGTSGLGLELVKLFHKKGFYVICTGRRLSDFTGFASNFRFLRIDFSNLAETAKVFKNICSETKPDFVINNAGILSPHEFNITGDGFEYTFQVNFLAHLLVNEIIVRNNPVNHPLKICAITSPVYKIEKTFPDWKYDFRSYKPLKAYSDSKLFLALMCRHLEDKYGEKKPACFSVDPGVFSSSIYRTRGRIFRSLYGIAAPFMRDPAKVAEPIFNMMVSQGFSDGRIFNIRKKPEHMPVYSQNLIVAFWTHMHEITGQYLKP